MKVAKIVLKVIIIMLFIIIMQKNLIFASAFDTDFDIGSTGAILSSKRVTEKMVGAFQVVGSVISVVALVIIGIRYMLSSVQEKAEMKGVLIYYIVGAILVFGTSNVLSIAYKAIRNL